MKSSKKPISLVIFFNLFFLIAIFVNKDSRNNFRQLGVTLQNIPFELKLLLNLVFVLVLLSLYIFLKYIFNLDFKDKNYLSKYHRFIILFCFVFFCFIPAAISSGSKINLVDTYFKLFGVGHLRPNFIDLRGTLAAINKVKYVGEGYQIDCAIEPCIGWRWTYGSSILKLNRFGIFSESRTYLFALFLIIIFLWTVFLLSNSIRNSIVFLLLIPTGTILLIIERMNIDILLLPLIYYLATLVKRRNFHLILAPLIIFLAASVKYYPLVLIFPLIIITKSIKIRIYYMFILLFGILYIIPELKLAGIENFNYGYSATYGLKNLIGLVNGSNHPQLVLSILTLIGAIMFLYISQISYKNFNFVAVSDLQGKINTSLYWYGFTILISSWLVNSNYPYRLVCVLTMIPFLIDNYYRNKELVITLISSVIVFFGTIHVTFSPIRNLTLAAFIALNIGILSKISFAHGNLYRRVKLI